MPRIARIAALIGAAVLLAACATGKRPSFAPDDSTADGAAAVTTSTEVPLGVDPEVLALFDTSEPISETAAYEVVQAAQGTSASVVLTRDATRTVIDVRDVQFRDSGGKRETCNNTSMACKPGFAEQQLSDLQISTGFWGPAVIEALTAPTMAARIGPITTEPDTIAGQAATCVNIPGPGRVDRYCALASGTLASMDTAAVNVMLTKYTPTFDTKLWNEFPHT